MRGVRKRFPRAGGSVLDVLEARLDKKAAVSVGTVYGEVHKSYEAAVAAVTRGAA